MKIKEKYNTMLLAQTQEVAIKRKELRITQEEMAFRCGVTMKTIQNFENYKFNNAYLVWAYNYYFENRTI
jgi:DNA-binding XRE family transcriptional regulator